MNKAKLPGLPTPNFTDPLLQRWALAVQERLEVREGSRGDPLEKVVTLRDLQRSAVSLSGGRFGNTPSAATLSGAVQVPLGNGLVANINIEAFAAQLRKTKLFRDLSSSINDPTRFAKLGNELEATLTRSIAAEAAIRGAQIKYTEQLVQEVSRSVSAVVTELTASVSQSAAGIRSVQFAVATETAATAGQVTQLEARLQVEVNPEDLLPVPPAAPFANLAALIAAVPAASADTRKYYRVAGTPEELYRSNGTIYSLVGTEESARLEEVLLVTADKSLGLEAQYTLKVNAGNAIAGFGLAATERDGVPDSSFIIQANRFALITPPDFSQSTTPTATTIGQTWYKIDDEQYYRSTSVGTGGWVEFDPVPPFGVDAVTGTVFVSNLLRIGGGTGVAMTDVQSGITNFNTRNDRNGAAIVTPVIATDGSAVDHVIRTDGSADVSLEWSWAGDNADIDGWLIRVYVNSDGAPYTFGSNPAEESEYYLSPEKRALIGYGYPADVYYKFGVQAYRIVDSDVSAGGIIKSTLVIPSLAAENPYRPSANIAFAGNITGTINGTAATTVVSGAANGTTALTAVNNPTTGLTPLNATALNFNNRNDRNATAVVAPTIAGDGTAIDHTVNTDGSVDVSFEWSWAGTEADIDGFIVTAFTNTDGAAYTFGTTPAAESEYFMPASKRAMIGYGFAADLYYKLSVQAYRIVDPDVNAAGIIRSARAIPSLAAENPYRPSANVAFAGNITGTVNNVAAGTLTSQAALGASAHADVNSGTIGLATKLGLASRNVLAGTGGIAVGNIAWNASGVVNSGFGVAITNKGIVARNNASPQVDTFVLDATTGNATFAGELSAATGTFSGALSAATGTFAGDISGTGFIRATGNLFDIDTNAAVNGSPTLASASGVLGRTSTGFGIIGIASSTGTGISGSSINGRGGNFFGATEALRASANASTGVAIRANVGNMIIGPATNTGNTNLVIKEGVAGSRLNDQMIIYGQLSASSKTTLGLIVEQDVESGTGSFAGLVQLRIHINGVAYKLPLEAY